MEAILEDDTAGLTSAEFSLNKNQRSESVKQKRLQKALQLIEEKLINVSNFGFSDSVENPILWLDSAINKLVELFCLPQNWDSYGAKPINEDKFSMALEMISGMMFETTPEPFISPTSNESIQFSWTHKGVELEIEVISRYLVDVYFEDETGEFELFEDKVAFDFRELNHFIKILSTR